MVPLIYLEGNWLQKVGAEISGVEFSIAGFCPKVFKSEEDAARSSSFYVKSLMATWLFYTTRVL